MRYRTQNMAKRIALYAGMTIGAVVMTLPFYFMIITSFKRANEMHLTSILSSLIVRHPTMQTYQDLLSGLPYLRFMGNSLLVAVLVTAGVLLTSTMAGFAFAKLKFPGRNITFIIILATMMIPAPVLLIPNFLLMRDLGWLNTFLPLIVPSFVSAFAIFLSRQFIQSVPDDLVDAARIDGCSTLRLYWTIILPLSRPLLATLVILTFLTSWNSFLSPLIYLFDEKLYTLPLGISLLQGRFMRNENIQMAGAVMAIIPVLILFFVMQKHIIKSLSSTGMKG